MLLSILNIQNMVGTTDFYLLSLLKINLQDQNILWLGFLLLSV